MSVVRWIRTGFVALCRRPVVAVPWLVLTALLGVRISASLTTIGSGWVATSTGEPSVATVQVGGLAWLLGIQPGDPYAPWEYGSGGEFVTTMGDLGLGFELPPKDWISVAVAVGLLVLAVLLRPWSARLGLGLMVMTSSVLALDLMGAVSGMIALGVAAAPSVMLGAGALALTTRQVVRVAVIAAALASAGTVGVVLAHADPVSWPTLWTASAIAPMVLAACVIGASAGRTLSSMTHAVRGGMSPMAALAREAGPVRTALREQHELSRDAFARWIHEVVLPPLSLGIQNVQIGEPATGVSMLRGLTEDLRDRVEEDQLTVLRTDGLPAALEDVLGRARSAGIRCELVVDEAEARPPWWITVGALRIAQEAVTNAVRHSGADHLWVRVVSRSDRLLMEIADDGVGLPHPAVQRQPGHVGLATMRALALETQADLRFIDRRPNGLVVRYQWGTP